MQCFTQCVPRNNFRGVTSAIVKSCNANNSGQSVLTNGTMGKCCELCCLRGEAGFTLVESHVSLGRQMSTAPSWSYVMRRALRLCARPGQILRCFVTPSRERERQTRKSQPSYFYPKIGAYFCTILSIKRRGCLPGCMPTSIWSIKLCKPWGGLKTLARHVFV